ncbi:unnamed protein product [Cochlearia groenlandica]
MSRLSLPPSLSINLPLMEEKPKTQPSSELPPSRLGCFPNEFPYEFDVSPAFSPGFTSPGDSTETEDESSDDEQDFLAGLTRRLAPSTQHKPLPYRTKSDEEKPPQSTLSQLGSPKSSLKRDNALGVISAAAGEVAKLKLGSYDQNAAFRCEQHYLQKQQQKQRLLLHQQMLLCSRLENHIHKRRVSDDMNLINMRNNAITNNRSWLHNQHAGASLKRPSSGTGVFLPRQYPATTSYSMRKSGSLTNMKSFFLCYVFFCLRRQKVLIISLVFVSLMTVNPRANLQSKVNILKNHDFDEFNNVGLRLNQFDYERMLARRTLLARQGNQERLIPHDWMFLNSHSF